LLRVRL